ncbi:EipB family protein [Acidisoma sp. C75]
MMPELPRPLARLGAFVTAIAAATAITLAPGLARAGTDLAAHQAFYRLTLASTGNSGVTSASGAMEYEVIDGCTGWATQQRLDLTVLDREGGDTHTVSDYTTWESKDGREFRFRIVQASNGTQNVQAGYAELPPGHPGFAIYTLPRKKRVPLAAGTVFPMTQTRRLIAAARAGKTFVSLPVFDGTTATGPENTFTIITERNQDLASHYPLLDHRPSFRAHLGYFGPDRTQMLPDTLIGMRYWNNGVAGDLSLDFGNFTMAGTLAKFQPLPDRCG